MKLVSFAQILIWKIQELKMMTLTFDSCDSYYLSILIKMTYLLPFLLCGSCHSTFIIENARLIFFNKTR